MANWLTLGTALTASTNPSPNTLSTVNPYPSPITSRSTASAAWTTQAKKALVSNGALQGGFEKPIELSFKPSGGDAVTYSVTLWRYNTESQQWHRATGTHTFSLTGYSNERILSPSNDPWFIQLASISSGTVSIYYEQDTATAI